MWNFHLFSHFTTKLCRAPTQTCFWSNGWNGEIHPLSFNIMDHVCKNLILRLSTYRKSGLELKMFCFLEFTSYINGVFHEYDIMWKHMKKMCLVVSYLIDHECCSPERCGTRQGRVSPHTPAGNLSSRRISTHISDVTICSSKYIKV